MQVIDLCLYFWNNFVYAWSPSQVDKVSVNPKSYPCRGFESAFVLVRQSKRATPKNAPGLRL